MIAAPVDDELEALHAAAFGGDPVRAPWSERLRRHSLLWVTARKAGRLVGFVNVVGDGGARAILLDTCVHPDEQGRGLGKALVRAVVDEAAHLCRAAPSRPVERSGDLGHDHPRLGQRS